MGCHDVAFTSVEVKNFDAKPGAFDHTVDQCLEANFVDLGLHRVYPRAAVLVQWHRKESLVPVRVELHPRASQDLQGETISLHPATWKWKGKNHPKGKTYSEVSNDSIRAVTLIKSLDKERLVLSAILDSSLGSVEDIFCGIDKDLVDGIRQANPFQKRSKRLHSLNLRLDPEGVSEGEKGLEITKCHSCIELA